MRHNQPVISVDAKKTELIGNFKNSGTRYCRQADEVNTYDFPSEAEGKAIPTGYSMKLTTRPRSLSAPAPDHLNLQPRLLDAGGRTAEPRRFQRRHT